MAKQEQHGAGAGTPPAQDSGAGLDAKGASRRRFGKAGLGASGVILTLASQPGMAANGVCTTTSGFLSTPMTSHTPRSACGGLSPGYWKNHHEAWAAASTDGNVPFSKVFPTGGATASLNTFTLFDVVDSQKVSSAADKNRVAMHIVAALLNARSGTTNAVLTEAKVREIWAQYAINTYYTPMTGAKPWSGDKIVQYLTSTFVDV